MKIFSFLVFTLFFFFISCDKQDYVSVHGGDVFYKDSIHFELLYFDSISSKIGIDINEYPLGDDFGKCDLFLAVRIYNNNTIGIVPTNSTVGVVLLDSNYDIGSYTNTINFESSINTRSDSGVFNFNFCYLFIEYNSRILVISDTLAWKDNDVVNPL